MLGTLVNAGAIAAGGALGLLLRGGISSRYSATVMQAMSLAVLLIGLSNALKTHQVLLLILCLAVGSMLPAIFLPPLYFTVTSLLTGS